MIGMALGGGFGAVSRYLLGKWISKRNTLAFPLGTFCINALGSFFIGLLFSLSVSEGVWNAIGIGFLGGFTTFSTFGYETIQLAEERKYRDMLLYVGGTLVVCFGFTWLGVSI